MTDRRAAFDMSVLLIGVIVLASEMKAHRGASFWYGWWSVTAASFFVRFPPIAAGLFLLAMSAHDAKAADTEGFVVLPGSAPHLAGPRAERLILRTFSSRRRNPADGLAYFGRPSPPRAARPFISITPTTSSFTS
jgi:hypothetical protein